MKKYILILFLIGNCFGQPPEWVEIPGQSKKHFKFYRSVPPGLNKWLGFPDPNYSWEGNRLSWERTVQDDDGNDVKVKNYRKPIEIIASFNPESKFFGIDNRGKIERAAVRKFGGSLKGFVWLDKISGGGEVVLPFTAAHIFRAVGDRLNPVLSEIGTDTSADNFYEIVDGKTHVYVKTFSGIGGAAGAPPTLIAFYPCNEDTASDNDEKVTGGDFITWVGDDPSGWTVTGESGNDPEISEAATGEAHVNTPTLGGGMCNIYSTGNAIVLEQYPTLVIGRKYRVSITINTETTGNFRFWEKTYGMWDWNSLSTPGTYTKAFVATATNPRAQIVKAGAVDITFDDISIKLCAAEDSSGNDHDMCMQQDTDAIHVAGKINGAFAFNGSSDFGEVGDTESDVKSIAMWVNPDAVNVTDSLIDLNGTDYITIVNSTVTKNGFGTGTQVIYVDGVVASTVTANWHLIVLTSTVGFDADDLDIGRKGAGYYDGKMDKVMFFSVELTPDEVKRLYNNNNGTEILSEIDSVIIPRRSNTSPLGTRARYEFP